MTHVLDSRRRAGRPWRRGALLVLVCGLVLPSRGGDRQSARPPESPTAPRGRVAVVLTPRRQAVLSAEVSARVVAVKHEFGEHFEAGAVLVQLDDALRVANQQVAQAQMTAAQQELTQTETLIAKQTRQRYAAANLEAARANLEATQRLFDDGHASQVDLANARRDVATAQTDVELVAVTSARERIKARRELAVAAGQLQVAQRELAACTIRAPYAGRVARIRVGEHELVDRGTPVIEIVDDTVLLAKFLLPSARFRTVHRGQELTLTITETGQRVSAKVSNIAAVLDPASVTFEVYAEVQNADDALRAGMNGWLELAGFEAQ